MKIKKRFFLPRPDPSVPLFLESVGFNPEQEPISRSEGFPYYHWLQTAVGEGKVTFGERMAYCFFRTFRTVTRR